MSVAQPSRRLSEADYLEIERAAEFKSEFFDGEMFAMAGGKPRHSRITTNFGAECHNRLKGGSCEPYNSDLRIKVEATGLFTYPDLSIIRGPLEFAQGTDDTVVNPAVLVEVLSGSTEAYDRGKKFEHYRRIPALREYILINQNEPRIEQFVRQADGHWVLNETIGLDATLELASLGVSIPMSEIYRSVEFIKTPIRARSVPES